MLGPDVVVCSCCVSAHFGQFAQMNEEISQIQFCVVAASVADCYSGH